MTQTKYIKLCIYQFFMDVIISNREYEGTVYRHKHRLICECLEIIIK